MSKPESQKAPVGEARWAHVPKPNTRFNKDGVYSIDLVVPADEAAELIHQLEQAHQNNLAEIKRNPKLKTKKIN